MKNTPTFVAIVAGISCGGVGCSPANDTSGGAGTTTVTTTVTVREGEGWGQTVRQAIAEGGDSDWLRRVERAGLTDWLLRRVNDVAWEICDMLWVGGDYNKIIDKLSLMGDPSRPDVLAVYSAAVGFTCHAPAGAPPGMPR